MMKNMTWKEALLPQPPSFNKKRNYEMKDVLGEGAFGKVIVSGLRRCSSVHIRITDSFNRVSERHGTSLQTSMPLPSTVRPLTSRCLSPLRPTTF